MCTITVSGLRRVGVILEARAADAEKGRADTGRADDGRDGVLNCRDGGEPVPTGLYGIIGSGLVGLPLEDSKRGVPADPCR